MEDDEKSGAVVDTWKAERSVWLMKCPLIISKSWQARAADSDTDSQPLAKVVLSLDPLRPDDPSAVQVLSLSTSIINCSSSPTTLLHWYQFWMDFQPFI